MPDLAQIAPLIVPILIGLIVLRLGLELLMVGTRRGKSQLEATQRAWGHYTTAMFFAAFILPFFKTFLAVPIQTGPLWALFVGGLIVSAVHTGWLSARQPKSGGPQPKPQPKAAVPAGAARSTQAVPKPPLQGEPVIQADTPPALLAQSPSSSLSIDRVMGKLPLPPVSKGRAAPLPLEQAEGWYARQDARLGRVLRGQELAAARIRLSTLKSMLLLGQIGTSEADGDVNMVLRQTGRG